MKLTAIERGTKTTDDYLATPPEAKHVNATGKSEQKVFRSKPISLNERRRRHAILLKALDKLNKDQQRLCDELGTVNSGCVFHWLAKNRPIPEHHMERLEEIAGGAK